MSDEIKNKLNEIKEKLKSLITDIDCKLSNKVRASDKYYFIQCNLKSWEKRLGNISYNVFYINNPNDNTIINNPTLEFHIEEEALKPKFQNKMEEIKEIVEKNNNFKDCTKSLNIKNSNQILILNPPSNLNTQEIAELMKEFILCTKDKVGDILNNNETSNTQNIDNNTSKTKQALNQILYGPPGTGKTYNTINKALEIIDLSFFEENKIDNKNDTKEQQKEKRKVLVNKFNELRKEGRIEFVTFHQNYSYEDFIEGIKPDTKKSENLSFYRKKGIFKSISEKALENLKNSFKSPEEISNLSLFINSMNELKIKVDLNQEKLKITDNVFFIPNENEEDCFRYSGNEWITALTPKKIKFIDLIKLFENDVKERQDIIKLSDISGLAKQHATYYFKAYKIIKDNIKQTPSVELESVSLQNYVIIIDEINRANISRVFGELITLIEEDKRWGNENQMELTLPSTSDDDEPFTVPSNLYIIGTMNTADKSIALLDIALRRRFKFIPMYPDYTLIDDKELEKILKKLNKEIKKQKGTDFMIGHSFFINKKFEDLEILVNNDLLPLVSEYFNNKEDRIINIFKEAGINIISDDNTFQLRYSKDPETSQIQNDE